MVTLVLITLFLAAAVVSTGIAVIAWLRRTEGAGFGAMAFLNGGVALWSGTDAVSLISRDARVVEGVLAFSYVGVCAVVAGWHVISFALADRTWRLSRWTGALLLVEPVLCVAAAVTNRWHGLFFDHFRVSAFDGVLVPVFGPFFWAHSIYSYLLLAFAFVRVVRLWSTTSSRYQALLLTLFISVPSAILNIVGLSLNGQVMDLTVIGFAATSPLMYWMIVRQSMPALTPVAHRHVFEKISDAIAVVDLNGRVLDLNPAADALLRALSRRPPADLRGQTMETILGPDTGLLPGRDLLVDADRERTIDSTHESGIDLSVRVSRLSGHRGRCIGWAIVARDITDLNRQRRDLEGANDRLREQLTTIDLLRADLAEQAVRDHLTGLHNRRHLMNALSEAIASDGPLSVALIDIDHFKAVNDRYGHAAGDAVLVHVATVLAGAVRAGDILARYGGEEFVLLLPDADGTEAARRVESLRRLVERTPLSADELTIGVTFSAGVAERTGAQLPEELLENADAALYAAKHGGRNRVELATPPIGRGPLAIPHQQH